MCSIGVVQEQSVFRTVPEMHFGVGVVAQVGPIARRHSKRALLITGAGSAKASGALDQVMKSLEKSGVRGILFDKVDREPTVAKVQEAVDRARSEQCGIFIGLGGGSPIDVAKCAAGMFYSNHPVIAHFRGREDMVDQTLPWIGIPTTAGAGAEATSVAVLTDEETGIKLGIRSWGWLARAAIVDPGLTVTCPPTVTAYSGMDAFVQAVESYTSRWATPLTEGISLEAAVQIARGLPRAFDNGRDIEARSQVARGATMAGIALANSRLGAVHGLAHAVGTVCGLPHGKACAVLLPSIIEYNLSLAEHKYARIARQIGVAPPTRGEFEAARDLLDFVTDLNDHLQIPRTLGEVGLKKNVIHEIIRQALPSGSLAANPRTAGKADLQGILLSHLQG